MAEKKLEPQKPTPAFVGASWLALLIGMGTYLIGLWNANMMLNEKGYYLALLLYGIFAVISVQKSVRDKAEGIPVTNVYYGIAWVSVFIVLLLLAIGLWNADLLLSEKGFYGVSMVMAMFAAIAVQKNVRDMEAFKELEDENKSSSRALFTSKFLGQSDQTPNTDKKPSI
ncbi:hypothetical protein AUR04nite_35150 [Glutamicibacter uratoxydans]|uniref:YiaAB two helix domain-containing protein n=1 Tax=Glutamicibacter uratoxydans TaxID=43667 RepID=A0A4Y4DTI1_GLUUR|nr:inner membrane protein YiaA [Glutamicibacter uratoxydans]GED07983.1 hypothetical protein AUR04nite_35150 [Glutamicibacter uratoxydans]